MLFCINEGLAESGYMTGTRVERTAIVCREVLKVADDRLSANRLAAEANAMNNEGGLWDLVYGTWYMSE